MPADGVTEYLQTDLEWPEADQDEDEDRGPRAAAARRLNSIDLASLAQVPLSNEDVVGMTVVIRSQTSERIHRLRTYEATESYAQWYVQAHPRLPPLRTVESSLEDTLLRLGVDFDEFE